MPKNFQAAVDSLWEARVHVQFGIACIERSRPQLADDVFIGESQFLKDLMENMKLQIEAIDSFLEALNPK